MGVLAWGVTLRQMEYLLTVIQEQSFTRASERLNVSQSGLSQQIQSLERSVGAALLERLPRGVRTTPAGAAYLRHATTALNADRSARRAVSDVILGRTGNLEIATVLSVAVGVLPASLTRWHTENPGVSVSLLEFSHRRLLEEAVATGKADLAVGPTPHAWPGCVIELGVERFVLVLPPGDLLAADVRPYAGAHPPAARRSLGTLPIERLQGRDWVMPARENGLSELVESHVTAAGLRNVPVRLRTSQTEAAARLGAAGVGVALLPANVIPVDLPGLLCEPDPPLTRRLAVYTRTEFDPATRRYVDVLSEVVPALDPPSSA